MDGAFVQNLINHILNGSFSQKICRICLLPLGDWHEDLFTVLYNDNEEYCVADILEEVCGVKLTKSDKFKTCSNCLKTASRAYEFYLKVKNNEELLNYYVDEIKNQVDLIIPDSISEDICIFVRNKSRIGEENICNKSTLKRSELLFNIEKENVTKNTNRLKCNWKDVHIQNSSRVIQDSEMKHPKKNEINYNIPRINGKIEETISNPWNPKRIKSDIKRKRKRNPMVYKLCSKCPVQYKFIGKLKEHMKTIHNIDLFFCKVCKAVIEDEQEFNNHLQTHTGLHICEICNAVFKKRKTIIGHLKWHEVRQMSQEGAHICEICGIILMNEEQLKEHMERKHVNKYTCYYCGKMYKVEASFDMHIKKHEMHMHGHELKKEKAKVRKSKESFTCSQCGKAVRDERTLVWHERLHAGADARPYGCGVCGRRFVSLGRRNQHALCAHTPPARRCPLCPALFHLRSMVNSHIKKVHLKTHKRRIRESKHKQVCWKTETVPIQELSVSIQNEILKMQTG